MKWKNHTTGAKATSVVAGDESVFVDINDCSGRVSKRFQNPIEANTYLRRLGFRRWNQYAKRWE